MLQSIIFFQLILIECEKTQNNYEKCWDENINI